MRPAIASTTRAPILGAALALQIAVLAACGAVCPAGACLAPGSPGPATSPTSIVSVTPTPATATPPEACHGMAHVYNPGRLHVLASCVRVRGVIISARQEPDGDLHVLLKVDPDQRDPRGGRFTNSVNDAKQGGDLVLEPVCVGLVIQPDAAGACAGYRNQLAIPPPGTHVVVTGPWVLDAPHGWLEMHPLERVEVLT
jgi:hypothetical protein